MNKEIKMRIHTEAKEIAKEYNPYYDFITMSFTAELTNENSLKQSMIDAGIEVEEFVYKGTPYRWFD